MTTQKKPRPRALAPLRTANLCSGIDNTRLDVVLIDEPNAQLTHYITTDIFSGTNVETPVKSNSQTSKI